MTLMLDANLEPVFADLATDPRFAEVAMELLAPRSYSARHDIAKIPGLECSACAPFEISFRASKPSKRQGRRFVPPVVQVPEVPIIQVPNISGPAARRAQAREFGPRGNGKRGKRS